VVGSRRCRSRKADSGERRMPKNGDKPLKNLAKGQAVTDNDGWRNARERKLVAKIPVMGQAALCQGLPVN
jgi:hypothetical protein